MVQDFKRSQTQRQGQEAAAPKKRYITPEGYARMKTELNDLWKHQRPQIIEEVAAAAAQGDRSENAEYIYGKKKLREIDRRIRFLGNRLDSLTVVAPSGLKDTSRIYFGAWFTAEKEDGSTISYRIVGPDEFDTDQGTISIDSPVARALLGKQVGDIATVKRPAGDMDLEVLAISYTQKTSS